MDRINRIIENSLLSQLTQEEELYRNVEEHLSQLNLHDYPEAKQILHEMKEVLKSHYEALNSTLDVINQENEDQSKKQIMSSVKLELSKGERSNLNAQLNDVSKILQEHYISLNHAVIGNSFIHTMARAVNSEKVAKTAFDHASNFNACIDKINALVPKILALELSAQSLELKERNEFLNETA